MFTFFLLWWTKKLVSVILKFHIQREKVRWIIFLINFYSIFCLFSTLNLYLACVRMYLRYLLIIIQIVVRNAMWSIYVQELEANEICYNLFEFLLFKWNENLFESFSARMCVCEWKRDWTVSIEHSAARAIFAYFLANWKKKKRQPHLKSRQQKYASPCSRALYTYIWLFSRLVLFLSH